MGDLSELGLCLGETEEGGEKEEEVEGGSSVMSIVVPSHEGDEE